MAGFIPQTHLLLVGGKVEQLLQVLVRENTVVTREDSLADPVKREFQMSKKDGCNGGRGDESELATGRSSPMLYAFLGSRMVSCFFS